MCYCSHQKLEPEKLCHHLGRQNCLCRVNHHRQKQKPAGQAHTRNRTQPKHCVVQARTSERPIQSCTSVTATYSLVVMLWPTITSACLTLYVTPCQQPLQHQSRVQQQGVLPCLNKHTGSGYTSGSPQEHGAKYSTHMSSYTLCLEAVKAIDRQDLQDAAHTTA